MSLQDYESDLTDLEGDDDPPQPPPAPASDPNPPQSRGATRPRRQPTKVELADEGILPRPSTNQYNLKDLCERVQSEHIDLNPPYQRDIAWSEAKQVALIDSFFRNLPVPQLIFNVRIGTGGMPLHTCIDGKQRITSIINFMNGVICHRDYKTGRPVWYKKDAGSRKTTLSPAMLQVFNLKQIQCIEYEELSDAQERDIFSRVQNGVPLTPAERMRAISGPWSDLVRDVQKTVMPSRDFFEPLGWGTAAGRDIHLLVLTMYMCHHYPQHKYVPITTLEKWLQDGRAVPAATHAAMLNMFRVLVELLRLEENKGCFDKITQIELAVAGVLVYVHSEKLSYAQLISAIAIMRKKVKEPRANTATTKAFVTFIKGLKPTDLPNNDNGDMPAAKAAKATVMAPATQARKAPTDKVSSPEVRPVAKAKRKRVVEESDDDDEPLVLPAVKVRKVKQVTAKAVPKRAAAGPSSTLAPVSAASSSKAPRPVEKKASLSAMKFSKKSAVAAVAEQSKAPPSTAATRVRRKSADVPIASTSSTPTPAARMEQSSHLATASVPVTPAIAPQIASTPAPPRVASPQAASNQAEPHAQVAPVRHATPPHAAQALVDNPVRKLSSDRLAPIRDARREANRDKPRISACTSRSTSELQMQLQDRPFANFAPLSTVTGARPNSQPPLSPLEREGFLHTHQPQPQSQPEPWEIITRQVFAQSNERAAHSQSPPVETPPPRSHSYMQTMDPRLRLQISTQRTHPDSRSSLSSLTSSPTTPSHPLIPLPPASSSSARLVSPVLPSRPLAGTHPPISERAATMLATPAWSASGVGNARAGVSGRTNGVDDARMARDYPPRSYSRN